MRLIVKLVNRTVELSAEGETSLLKVLQKNGIGISANCGGAGKCGKCRVKITEGKVSYEALACRVPPRDGMIVELSDSAKGNKTAALPPMQTDGEDGVGLALDIGTTTLAYYFMSLKTGEVIDIVSELNPQRSFGADVISRISYADENGIAELNKCLKTHVNGTISSFLSKVGLEKIDVLAVTGNTVMLHIFACEEISSFGRYPFTPVFLEKREYLGSELGYNAEKVICLPSFSSFVGADIVCGAVATDVMNVNGLLVDLGTNGEMLLNCNGKIYIASVAAGPAFEGADIECGMGGVSGAIRKVRHYSGGFEVETVDNGAPTGICGAGLIDAVAYMLEAGIIDETGAFLNETGRFYLSDNVYITAADIRKFQLAKSAVRSGIEILLSIAKDEGVEVTDLFLCGGLGNHIDIESAVKVGLIPPELFRRVRPSGNAAGTGAAMCMLSSSAMKRAEQISKNKINVELSSNARFVELFAEYMAF